MQRPPINDEDQQISYYFPLNFSDGLAPDDIIAWAPPNLDIIDRSLSIGFFLQTSAVDLFKKMQQNSRTIRPEYLMPCPPNPDMESDVQAFNDICSTLEDVLQLKAYFTSLYNDPDQTIKETGKAFLKRVKYVVNLILPLGEAARNVISEKNAIEAKGVLAEIEAHCDILRNRVALGGSITVEDRLEIQNKIRKFFAIRINPDNLTEQDINSLVNMYSQELNLLSNQALHNNIQKEKFEQKYQILNHACNVITQFIALHDPKKARQFSVISNTGLTFAKEGTIILELIKAGVSLITLAPHILNIGQCIPNLLSLMWEEQPSEWQIVQFEIQELSKKIDEFRSENRVLFQNVYQMIASHHKIVMDEFTKIHQSLIDIEVMAKTYLERIDIKTNANYNLGRDILFNQKYNGLKDYIDELKTNIKRKNRLTNQNLDPLVNRFMVFGLTTCYDKILVGPESSALNDFSDLKLSQEFSCIDISRNIQYFSLYLGKMCSFNFPRDLPNYRVWAEACYGLMLVKYIWNGQNDILSNGNNDLMMLSQNGLKIIDFVSKLQQSSSIFEKLLKRYRDSINELKENGYIWSKSPQSADIKLKLDASLAVLKTFCKWAFPKSSFNDPLFKAFITNETPHDLFLFSSAQLNKILEACANEEEAKHKWNLLFSNIDVAIDVLKSVIEQKLKAELIPSLDSIEHPLETHPIVEYILMSLKGCSQKYYPNFPFDFGMQNPLGYLKFKIIALSKLPLKNIFYLAKYSDNCDLLRETIQVLGVDSVNAPDLAGKTPLHHAAAGVNKPAVIALLECKANPRLRDNKGNTPLHFAVWNKSVEICKALLSAGSDPYLENHGKMSSLQIVNNCKDPQFLKQFFEICELCHVIDLKAEPSLTKYDSLNLNIIDKLLFDDKLIVLEDFNKKGPNRIRVRLLSLPDQKILSESLISHSDSYKADDLRNHVRIHSIDKDCFVTVHPQGGAPATVLFWRIENNTIIKANDHTPKPTQLGYQQNDINKIWSVANNQICIISTEKKLTYSKNLQGGLSEWGDYVQILDRNTFKLTKSYKWTGMGARVISNNKQIVFSSQIIHKDNLRFLELTTTDILTSQQLCMYQIDITEKSPPKKGLLYPHKLIIVDDIYVILSLGDGFRNSILIDQQKHAIVTSIHGRFAGFMREDYMLFITGGTCNIVPIWYMVGYQHF